MPSSVKFSQRHPFLFGLFLLFAAVVLFMGAMAVFRIWPGAGLFPGGPKLGLVRVQGTIESPRAVVDWVHKLQRDSRVKGILVRINSPGGLVAPSQEIHSAVAQVDKPVVVSMGQVAASGGYYVACGADRIVANPGTITGSIGVKANVPNVRELMKSLGIRQQTIVSGEFKDAGSPTRPLTDKERRYFQNLVDNLFGQFVDAVAEGRKMEPEKVRKLADGRAFTGVQAKEKGLVDALGGRSRAKSVLKEMCGISQAVTLVEGPERKRSLLRALLDWFGLELGNGVSRDSGWIVRY
ncbi:MAG: signal peptide peptidase SppA [Desulfohalobiaceae bacterium]|nr:signal peptide peptidase SppA [Desulfohalobiaceae bacterium]